MADVNEGSAMTVDPAQPSPADRASPYAWYALSLLFLVYVFNFVDRQIITILAPDLKADLGLNDADIGFLYGTSFAVFYALFGIPLGRLADSWHRVRLMTIGLGLWSAMTAMSGLAANRLQLSVARMGVGIGEATAGPASYSLISDLFPKRMRATALAIYSAGLYFGGGISLMIGGAIVDRWNTLYPGGGPLGLVGWQVAFMAVGLPGLLLAAWVATLREPIRGLVDGVPTAPHPQPFKGFSEELFAIIPPFTIIAAARRGSRALIINLLVLGAVAAAGWIIVALRDSPSARLQWGCIGFGVYAVFSWAASLKERDPPTFALIWRSRAFLSTIFGYGTVAFMSYATTAFVPTYAQQVLGEPAKLVGLWIGGMAAVSGFLGVIIGGRVSDALRQRYESGRIMVVLFGLLAPGLFVWLAFTTHPDPHSSMDFVRFVACAVTANFLGSSALGAAAATTQDLVLPRMRGTATATFFVATTLYGLAMGPYMAGQVSTITGDLSVGVRSALLLIPVGLTLLIIALRTVPHAAASVVERARAAGEPI